MGLILGALRLVLRLLGLALLLASLAAFGFVAVVFMLPGDLAAQPLEQVWLLNDPFAAWLGTASLPLLGAIIEQRLHPSLWDPGLATVLGWPSWIGLLTIGGATFAIGAILFNALRRRPARRTEPPARPAN